MGKTAIKNRIIKQINETEDEDFLQEVESVISHLLSDKKEIIKLSPEIIAGIEAAEQDIKYGRVKSHEEVMKEAKKWLKKK